MAVSAFASPLAIAQRPLLSNPGICSRSCASTRFSPSRASWRMNVASQTFKATLLERVAPLEFGRTIADDPAQQEEIEALIRQVEATNTSTSPGTDPNLTGVWDMVYTTSQSVLGMKTPPFLRATRIVQELNGEQLSGRNAETFKIGPLEVENAVEAKLTPTSPSKFNVNFVRFVVARLLKINVEANERFTGWLEVTYLDKDLRISRGNKGNVFVLVKKDT